MNTLKAVMKLQSIKARYDNAPKEADKEEIAALVQEYDKILTTLKWNGVDVSDIPSITEPME